ncbi:MAG: oxidoreductase [Betaproteobacteria bacterium]|nr:oxidoreductase [Betaproteobacteria bacterium]
MATKRIAIIAGSTGLVGRHLIEQLLASPRYSQVHAIGRRAPSIVHEKLHVIASDLQSIPTLPSVDDAFCCLGTTIRKAGSQAAFRAVDFDMVINFAKAARQAGAKRFLVVSSLGANTKSAVFYSRVKGEAEQALQEIRFESLTFLRPSFLIGERAEARAGERLGIKAFSAVAPLMIGPMRKLRPIRAQDVAAAMVSGADREAPGEKVMESDQIARGCIT